MSLDTHPNFITVKGNYQSFSRALRIHLDKDYTILSSKLPKSDVKLVTYINIVNGFNLIVASVFLISPTLRLILPQAQDLVISFCLGEGGTLPQFHLRALHFRNENFLLNDETGQVNNLTGK